MRNGNSRARLRACGSARTYKRKTKSKPAAESRSEDLSFRPAFASRLSAYAFGFAFFGSPQLALATDLTFDNASDFQSKLAEIIGSSGANTLTYTGATAPMLINGTLVAPGSSSSLTVNLGQSLQVGATANGSLTLGTGTALNLGSQGDPHLRVGSADYTGELNVNGGVVNISKAGATASLRVGYGTDNVGTLRITNGGVVNLGTETGANYSQVFTGWNGSGDIVMNNGTLNLGGNGASIRLGIGGTSTVTMTNGSMLDSSLHGSHLWVGDTAGGTATLNIDNSTIIIDGTNAADKDRYVAIGHSGGTGVVNQTGANSLVRFVGLGAVGIGEGNGSHGTYNLNGGRLEVGNDTKQDSFHVGLKYWGTESAATAIFNVNGGTADIKGNLGIGNGGGNGKFANGTVNLNSGLIDVGGKVVFGQGVGTLNLNGGVLELGGTNAITGSATSTINAAGGTLRAGSDLTASHGMNLGLGGITFDSNAHSITYSGVLTGTGGLTKVGAGTLLLTGANTYTGDTLIRGGVLETGHGTSLGSGGAIVLDGGTLKLSTMVAFDGRLTAGVGGGTVDLASQNIDWSGSLAGDGTLKFVNGIVTLTGVIDSSGELVLDDGASLVAGADNQLSPDTSLTIGDDASFDNGTFTQSIAGLSGRGTISNDGVIDVGGTGESSTFGGTLNGTGTLEKSGSGSFEFTGSGNFSGTVGVNGGHMAMNGDLSNADFTVGQGASLGGNGTMGSVTGQPGATFRPGNSIDTIQVINDFRLGGATYEVEINAAGGADKTEVGGVAYLDDSPLSIVAEPGVYTAGTTYQILTATSIDGRFADPTINLAFFQAMMDYGSDYVSFTLERNGLTFADVADTRNQRATAGGAESLGEGNAVYDAIFQQDVAGVRTALDVLSGEVHASAKTMLIEDSRHVRDAANDRVRAAFTDQPATATWARTFGSWADAKGDGNAAGMDRSLGGILSGVDGSLDDWRLGMLAGYSQTSFQIGERASSGKADTVHVGLYGGRQWGSLGLRSGMAYSFSDIATDRSADFEGFSDDLSADYTASTFQAFGELGYTVTAGAVAFEPFANLTHVHLASNGFTETGEEAALRVAGSSTDTTFSTLGLRLSGDLAVATLPVTARAMIGWRHAMGDITPVSRHAFAGSSGFTVAGLPVATDAALLEAGLGISLSQAATLGLSYNGQIASGTSDHTGRIDLAVKF